MTGSHGMMLLGLFLMGGAFYLNMMEIHQHERQLREHANHMVMMQAQLERFAARIQER